MHGYKYVIEHYIRKGLGGMLVRELTPATVQAWIDTLATPQIARRCRNVLHNILEEAVRLNLLMLNPAERVTTPSQPPSTAQAWSTDEARQFLAAATEHPYQPYWTLALRLGLRPS